MYVCIYIYVFCLYVCVYMYVYMYACICVWTYVCTYVQNIYTYLHTYIYVCVCLCVCVWVYVLVFSVYWFMYVCISKFFTVPIFHYFLIKIYLFTTCGQDTTSTNVLHELYLTITNLWLAQGLLKGMWTHKLKHSSIDMSHFNSCPHTTRSVC